MADTNTKPKTEYIPAPVSPAEQRERDFKGTLVKITLNDAARALYLLDIPYPIEYSGKSTTAITVFNKKTRKKEKRIVRENFGMVFRNKDDMLEYLTAEHMKDQFVTDVRIVKGRLYLESSNKGKIASNDYYRTQICGLWNIHDDGVLTRKQVKSMFKRLFAETNFDGSKLAAPIPKFENKITKN